MSAFPAPVELNDEIVLPKLPPIDPRFFVPRFSDKPQDPIMETLKLSASAKSKAVPLIHFDQLPKELLLMNEKNLNPRFPPHKLEDSIWIKAEQSNVLRHWTQIQSWDNLRSSIPPPASSSGFLSEQDSIMFAAARHHALPILNDGQTIVQYVSVGELLKNMKMIALGFSSLLHEWHPGTERFVDTGVDYGMRKVLIIEGKDDTVSLSFVSQFLRIGTSLRRLETLVEDLRSRTNIGPTVHGFVHAVSTCLVRIRQYLASGPPTEAQLSDGHPTLSSVLMYYSQYEELLTALSVLCNRGESVSPGDYKSIPPSPQSLLSMIYDQLHGHMEQHSSHSVLAILAFILTSSSREYFTQVSRSVGFGGLPNGPASNLASHERQDDFPSFFPSELVNALPIARKSLRLLRAAQPDHPLLHSSEHPTEIAWFWTLDEILAAVNSDAVPEDRNVATEPGDQIPSTSKSYAPEIAQFRIYDLEPGRYIGRSAFDVLYTSAPGLVLDDFIKAFPPTLPLITPTLTHLTSLVLRPLFLHASTLSNTLLSLFLSLPAPLDIHSHLQLLRSCMLLMSPSFRARLSAALFSDSGDFDADAESSSMGLLRRRSQPVDLKTKTWAVGLAPALLDRATWPPMDTDLSFFLRTVIMDSFEDNDNEETHREKVEEIENRLGFAVRDLPGQDAWLNPLHIEALDFLYMDYKPPRPLDVIITTEVLSKYQRMFSFLLRILRVQNAVHAVFRMSNRSSRPLFETLTSSRKMLLHFRFLAQSFVTNLAEYVYDTAISGNLDPFLASLQPHTSSSSAARRTQGHEYSDVFSLANAHSDVLNDILTACLLRTGQKTAGGLLRDALNLVLEFAVLTGDLYRGRLEEYEAAPVLQKLFSQFQKKMANLIKVLNGTVDENVSIRTLLDVSSSTGSQAQWNPIGGSEALPHLLVRLDLGEWWSSAGGTQK